MKRKQRVYIELTPAMESLFNRFGFYRLDEYGKPYYINLNEGKVYKPVDTNKLKQMKDGASEKEYGNVNLRQKDGTFKNRKTHRLCLAFDPISLTVKWDRLNGLVGDHINGNKGDNRRVNLEAVTQSENMRRAWARKRKKEAEAAE